MKTFPWGSFWFMFFSKITKLLSDIIDMYRTIFSINELSWETIKFGVLSRLTYSWRSDVTMFWSSWICRKRPGWCLSLWHFDLFISLLLSESYKTLLLEFYLTHLRRLWWLLLFFGSLKFSELAYSPDFLTMLSCFQVLTSLSASPRWFILFFFDALFLILLFFDIITS